MNKIENVEYIYAHPSLDGNEGLLAIIIRNTKAIDQDKIFITDDQQPLQLGILNYQLGQDVKPHIHIPRKRTIEQTQEILLVTHGIVNVKLYDSIGNYVNEVTLISGQIIILCAGGHSLKFFDDTQIIEVRNGPYLSREYDKIDFPE